MNEVYDLFNLKLFKNYISNIIFIWFIILFYLFLWNCHLQGNYETTSKEAPHLESPFNQNYRIFLEILIEITALS